MEDLLSIPLDKYKIKREKKQPNLLDISLDDYHPEKRNQSTKQSKRRPQKGRIANNRRLSGKRPDLRQELTKLKNKKRLSGPKSQKVSHPPHTYYFDRKALLRKKLLAKLVT